MEAVQTDQFSIVKTSIDAWIHAVESKDITQLPKVVAQDADSVWVGVGTGDWMVGFDALEQAMRGQNAALDEIQIQVSDETIHVSAQGDLAWATNQWVFNGSMGGQPLSMNLRCTWVLEKRQGKWMIVHFHKSVGMPM